MKNKVINLIVEVFLLGVFVLIANILIVYVFNIKTHNSTVAVIFFFSGEIFHYVKENVKI